MAAAAGHKRAGTRRRITHGTSRLRITRCTFEASLPPQVHPPRRDHSAPRRKVGIRDPTAAIRLPHGEIGRFKTDHTTVTKRAHGLAPDDGSWVGFILRTSRATVACDTPSRAAIWRRLSAGVPSEPSSARKRRRRRIAVAERVRGLPRSRHRSVRRLPASYSRRQVRSHVGLQ